jgi:hypothetical protein
VVYERHERIWAVNKILPGAVTIWINMAKSDERHFTEARRTGNSLIGGLADFISSIVLVSYYYADITQLVLGISTRALIEPTEIIEWTLQRRLSIAVA